MRKESTDGWDNTRGRSEGPERHGTSFQGKMGNDISISIRCDLEVGGEAVFHLRGKICFEKWPREERGGEAWTAREDGDGDLDNTNTVGGK